MSTNRPPNTSSNNSGTTGKRPPSGTTPRPTGQTGQLPPSGTTPRPAGQTGPRPPAAQGQRPPTGSARQGTSVPPAKRPAPQPSTRVQVRPTRPQARGGSGSDSNRYIPFLIGGGLLLVAVILIATLFLNNSGSTGSTGTGGSAAGGGTAVVETNKGTFKIHLFTDDPSVKGAVKNFQDKANSGYFNGLTFHRVEDWVIQGGDPQGTGTGGGDMPGEYNDKPFKRGAVGMASTAGHAAQVNDSQWFVVKSDADYLNGQYTNFGQVTEGMDVVDKIAIGDKMTKITIQP